MQDSSEPSLLDHEDLKQRIKDAVRAVIQQRADELGISYEDCLDRFFGPRA
jgi:hypothetical protein